MPDTSLNFHDRFKNWIAPGVSALPSFSLCCSDGDDEFASLFTKNALDSDSPEQPRHSDFFSAENASPVPVFCPDRCCLGLSLREQGILAMGFDDPLPQALAPLAGMILSMAAREIEHQRQIRHLQKQVEFGEKVVQSMSSGFLVLAPDLSITNANQAACSLLDATMEDLTRSKLSDYVRSKLLVKEVFATGKPIIDQEVVIKLADRDLRIIKTATPVFDENGAVIAVLDHFRETKEAHKLATRLTGAKASFSFDNIVHRSDSMHGVVELAKIAANNSLSIVITGESGTGKELFAQAIHTASKRRHGPFVVIDCTSIPRELVASELFGYVEGAFTGTRKGGMPGKFELADGGTIFLDELAELPLEIQPQLLRVLQNRELSRLGSKDVIPVDIRVIAATNRNLPLEVKKGNFREDLYYRLNVFALHVPSLRSRPEDIALLAEYFCEKYCNAIEKPRVSISGAAMEILQRRDWHGNVRELENTVAKAVHICDDCVMAEHVREAEQLSDGSTARRAAQSVHAPDYAAGTMRDAEEQIIRQAIKSCAGNISQAAKQLGMSRSTIYKKMIAWGEP